MGAQDIEKPSESPNVVEIIEREARAAGIDPRIALAFAWAESGLRPDALGDADWATKNDGRNYRMHVLGNPELAHNPARHEPSAWRSYGLFQLLAPYHVRPMQHPRELLAPELNARLGVARIAALLRLTGGDALEARRRYVGCPPERCSPAVLGRVDTRWGRAAQRFGVAAT